MTKYMTINGVKFELIKTPKTKDLIAHWRYAGRTLNDCYEKPSQIKREIYDEWLEWYYGADYVQAFGVASYNGFNFTIGALLIGENMAGFPIGYIQITKTHNRIYMLG